MNPRRRRRLRARGTRDERQLARTMQSWHDRFGHFGTYSNAVSQAPITLESIREAVGAIRRVPDVELSWRPSWPWRVTPVAPFLFARVVVD